MSREIKYNIAIGKFTSLALYLGIGAMLHALIIGATFDWSSAWTWGVLFGWPILFTLAVLALGLAIMALVFAGLGIEHVWSKFRKRKPIFRR